MTWRWGNGQGLRTACILGEKACRLVRESLPLRARVSSPGLSVPAPTLNVVSGGYVIMQAACQNRRRDPACNGNTWEIQHFRQTNGPNDSCFSEANCEIVTSLGAFF